MLNTIENVRAQIESLNAPADVRAPADSVEKKFMAVEGNIVDLRMTGRGQDEVRYPVKLGGQLNYLAGGISASDFTPTAQQREVDQVLAKEVRDTRAALQAVIQNDLAKLNVLLRSKGLKTIDATLPAVVF
jgi:hypothetical protein